ncbi:MAG TPA: hypothetical protein VN222_07500, partial [Novosphingobium sp.]|nr:hypothetical protein [Novosphingobium sp.]
MHFRLSLPSPARRCLGMAAAFALPLAAPLAAQAAPAPQTDQEAQQQIWAKEQSIYAARGAGNLDAYINAVATGYAAWPPFAPQPTGVEALKAASPRMAVENHELLAMEFVRLVRNGDTAIIYYQTHR